MLRFLRLFLVLSTLLSVGFPTPPVHAQGPAPRRGMSERLFNPKSVETVQGKVSRVETPSSRRQDGQVVVIVLATPKGELFVHLGPRWYLDQQPLKLKPEDTIRVTGSRVMVQGKSVILASEIKRGNEKMVLRKEDGTPVWAGQRRGR